MIFIEYKRENGNYVLVTNATTRRVDRSPDTGVNGYKQFNGRASRSLRVIVIIGYAAVVIKIGVT